MHITSQTPAAASESTRRAQARYLPRAMRLPQWIKNLLVFVPILLSGRLFEIGPLCTTAVAFLAVGMVASAGYMFNDLRDVSLDRAHAAARHRPIASGRISPGLAFLAALVLCVCGLGIALLTSPRAAAFLACYLLLTIAYTLALKQIPLVDSIALAMLFTLRLLIGIAAADVRTSPWLLAFSMFIFTSLSLARRHGELAQVIQQGRTELQGRGYRTVDLPVVLTMGLGAGIGATLIAVLYILDDAYVQTFYGNKVALWALPLIVILYVSRVWLKCQRNEMTEHPLDFTLKDTVALGLASVALIMFMIAWLGRPLF